MESEEIEYEEKYEKLIERFIQFHVLGYRSSKKDDMILKAEQVLKDMEKEKKDREKEKYRMDTKMKLMYIFTEIIKPLTDDILKDFYNENEDKIKEIICKILPKIDLHVQFLCLSFPKGEREEMEKSWKEIKNKFNEETAIKSGFSPIIYI